MNAILVALAVFGAADVAAKPRGFRVEVTVCEGDPQGNRADGTIVHLAEVVVVTPAGQPAFVRNARGVLRGPGGQGIVAQLGTDLELVPYVLPTGDLLVELKATRTALAPGPAVKGALGFTECTTRSSSVTKAGSTIRVPLGEDSPKKQAWVEVTVTEVKP